MARRQARRYTEAEKAQFAANREQALAEVHEQLTQAVTDLTSGEQWQKYLRFAASFHQYSFRNVLLIMMQRPTATAVASYKAWQAHGRQVQKGEQGIRVLAPLTRRMPKVDPDSGEPVRDAGGKPVMQSKVYGFKLVSVFDVAQTEGDPLPERPKAQLLHGMAPEGVWDSLAGYLKEQGYTVTRGACQGGADGTTYFRTREVRVRDDVDDAHALLTLYHEAAHVMLHAPDAAEGVTSSDFCRGTAEVEAESVAYLAMNAHGITSGENSFPYVAGWAEQAAHATNQSVEDVITATGTRVIGTANTILDATLPAEQTPADEALNALEAAVTSPGMGNTAPDRIGETRAQLDASFPAPPGAKPQAVHYAPAASSPAPPQPSQAIER